MPSSSLLARFGPALSFFGFAFATRFRGFDFSESESESAYFGAATGCCRVDLRILAMVGDSGVVRSGVLDAEVVQSDVSASEVLISSS